MKLSAACRALSVLAAWALGLALSARLASMGLPPAELPSTVREKLAHLAAHGGEYDAIFVGSSRIQNHLMPALFDRLTAEGGKPVKSFNAGVSSMHTPEDGWFLEQILARKPARLRWVFLEIDFFEPGLQDGQAGTQRGVPWHDWTRFRQLCRRLAVMTTNLSTRDEIADFFERQRDFIDHLATFGQRQTQLGRGAQLFDRWRFAETPEPMHWENLGENGDGFVPAKSGRGGEEKHPARLASVLAARKKEPPAPSTADRVSQAVLGEAIAQIRRAGAVPILVMPPRTRVFYFVPSAENARHALVIDLCRPAEFPALYDARYRVDTSHFTAEGAELFTRLVAGRFLEIAHAIP